MIPEDNLAFPNMLREYEYYTLILIVLRAELQRRFAKVSWSGEKGVSITDGLCLVLANWAIISVSTVQPSQMYYFLCTVGLSAHFGWINFLFYASSSSSDTVQGSVSLPHYRTLHILHIWSRFGKASNFSLVLFAITLITLITQ